MNAPPAGHICVDVEAAGRAGAPAPIVRSRRRLSLVASAVAVLALAIGLFTGLAPAAFAAGSAVNQCNGVYNTGGQAVECHVVIQNRLDIATGVSSSDSTIEACHGSAGGALTCTTTPLDALATSVTQCNGSALGGGATLLCTVQVTNTITGSSTSAPITVNQCIGSGGGGGTQPTVDCSPIGSTTNADITQCNGSANNGGGTRRVRCTVTPSTSSAALPVTINQCNGSTAGGSTVTCTSSIVNIFVPPTTTTPPTTAPTTTASSSRPRPSGSVRPTIASRPATSAPATTTPRKTTSGSGTATRAASSTSTNGVGTATRSSAGTGTTSFNTTTTSFNTTTTSLASTGVPAIRQALLAMVLLAAGAGLMVIGRKARWIGKHR